MDYMQAIEELMKALDVGPPWWWRLHPIPEDQMVKLLSDLEGYWGPSAAERYVKQLKEIAAELDQRGDKVAARWRRQDIQTIAKIKGM